MNPEETEPECVVPTSGPPVCPEVMLAMLNFDCQPKAPVLRVEVGFYFYCLNPEGLLYIIIF